MVHLPVGRQTVSMSAIGASPEQLDSTSLRFARGAETLTEAERRVSAAVAAAFWVGPVATNFRAQWAATLRPDMIRVSGSLAEAGRELTRQANEQRRASQADGGPMIRGEATSGSGAVAPSSEGEGTTSGRGAGGSWEPGPSPTEVSQRIADNRSRMEADLKAGTGDTVLLKKLLDSNTQVLLYDPQNNQIAIVHGNIETADIVVVTVPGTGTTPAAYAPGSSENVRAKAIGDMAAQLSNKEVATIAWLGYDAPQWDYGKMPSRISMAEEGGPALADFVQGLDLTPSQSLSIVAHSYGTTVTGIALREGMPADNVIVLGSPGMSVNAAADLHMIPGADLFSMAIKADPVANLKAFGVSPTSDSFGATRLRADGDGLFTHSQYWQPSNVNQIAQAIIDGKPMSVSGPQTLGEGFVYVESQIHDVANRGVDQVQRVLPPVVNGPIDVVQRGVTTVKGVTTAVQTEVIDVSTEVVEAGVEYIIDHPEDLLLATPFPFLRGIL